MPEALVVRTAAVYGHRGAGAQGGSFPHRVVERARRGETLRMVDDQRVNPTYAADLAAAAKALAGGGLTGIVHAVAAGCCTWLDFAVAAIEAAGFTARVEAITSDAFPAAARRPANGCLTSERLAPLRPWREALREWAARSRAEARNP